MCVNQCTFDVHYNEEDGVARSREENCVGCHRCAAFCPTHALTIHRNPLQFRANYNWSQGVIEDILKQAERGGTLLTGRGTDPNYVNYWDHLLLNASQVTNPSIDPLREPMELRTYVGLNQVELNVPGVKPAGS